MIRMIWSYIRFFFRSTNQHGVHSPFVFELVTRCFYDKTRFNEYRALGNYRQHLLKDRTTIAINDLGSGSHRHKNINRQIRDIAKHSGTTLIRSKLLFRLVRYFKYSNILELGTSLGIGTHAMLTANPDANIKTIEGCPNIAKYAQSVLDPMRSENLEVLVGDFETVLNELKPATYDLIFVDGNHQKSATLNYFNRLINSVHNNSVMIFDDIHWSAEMESAWAEIITHPKVRVSIDTFFWGLVFFRAEQAKEHFNIRL